MSDTENEQTPEGAPMWKRAAVLGVVGAVGTASIGLLYMPDLSIPGAALAGAGAGAWAVIVASTIEYALTAIPGWLENRLPAFGGLFA